MLFLMESVGCDSGENPQAQLDLHSRAGWPKNHHAWVCGDGPPKHSKSPCMVANIHNGEGECQVVCCQWRCDLVKWRFFTTDG